MCHFTLLSVIIILLFKSRNQSLPFSGYLIAHLGTLITVYSKDPCQDYNNSILQPDNFEIVDFM